MGKNNKEIKAIKPHLVVGECLGMRYTQAVGIIPCSDELWATFADIEMAKQILRGGNLK